MSSSTSDSQPETNTQSDSKTVEKALYDLVLKYLKSTNTDEEKSKDTKLQDIVHSALQQESQAAKDEKNV